VNRSLKKHMPHTAAQVKSGDWTVIPGRKHVKLRHPSGAVVTSPATPSDWRSDKNTAAQMRRVEKGLTNARGE
jgi:hypothetical protein